MNTESKHLPNQSTNSFEGNSRRAPEPIKKACPSLPKVKGSCPTCSKIPINSYAPHTCITTKQYYVQLSNERTMPASRLNKIAPCCSNESLNGDLPAKSIYLKSSESTVKQFTLSSLI